MADYSDYLSNLMIQCQRSVQQIPDWTYPPSQGPRQFAPSSQNSLQWYHSYAWGLPQPLCHDPQCIAATVSTRMPQQTLYTEYVDPPWRALSVTPLPPYPSIWDYIPNQDVTGTFIEGQQNTISTPSLRELAERDASVKAEGSEARGLDTHLIPLDPASSNEYVNQKPPITSYKGLKVTIYNTSSPAVAKGTAPVKIEASETSGISVTVPELPPVPPRSLASTDAPSQNNSSAFVEGQEDATTGTLLPEAGERTTLVKTEASGSRGDNKTVLGVQPSRWKPRKQEQNIGGYDNEVLLRCCLKKKIYYEYRAFAKFWTIVQLDFQLETRTALDSARETVLDLLNKRRMERAEEQRTGRAPYPQVLSKIRPLLDEFQELMDSGVAGDTTRERPTGIFASGSGTHGNKDCSANPAEERFTKVNEKIAQKRSFAEILGGTEAAKEIAQRPFKRRAMAEASEGTEDDADSGLSGSRTEDDASSDASDLPSDTVSETSEDIDSLLSALDEDDSDSEEVSKDSSLESSEDSDEDSSECGQRRASPPMMMRHRREPAAELVGLKQSVMMILDSASELIDTIHNLKAGRSIA